jgi:hypothetical protein
LETALLLARLELYAALGTCWPYRCAWMRATCILTESIRQPQRDIDP